MVDNRPPATLLSTGVMLPRAAGGDTAGDTVIKGGTAINPPRGPKAVVTGGGVVDTPAPAALLSSGTAVLSSGAARLNTGTTLPMTGAAMLNSGAATLGTGAATLSTGATLLSGTGVVVMGGRRPRAGAAVGACSTGLLSAGGVSTGVPVGASRGANSEVARVTPGARLLTSSGVAAGREDTSGVDSPSVVTGSCTGKGFSVGAPMGRGTAGASGAASGDTAAEQRAPSPLPVEVTVTAWLKGGSAPHRSGLFDTSLHARQTTAASRCAALVPDARQAPRVAPSQGCREGTFTGQADVVCRT